MYPMGARIISLVNQKGGVGKTTTAVNLAGYLSEAGKRVLLIDLDPQGNATSGIGHKPEKIEFGVYHALGDPSRSKEAVLETKYDNMHLIPSSPDLAGANVDLVTVDEREFRLRRVITSLKDSYEYIIIDNSPSLGLLAINGLVASNEIVIPVQAEYYALEGLRDLLHTINLVQNHLNPHLDIAGAVVTMYDSRNSLSGAVVRELQSYFPNRLFETIIPRNVRLAEAPSYGSLIKEYDPKSKGAEAYRALAKEIINME